MNEFNNKEILVLSGGGIKGIALIGALKALEEKNKLEQIITFAGTSIGGIIACMLVIGYTVTELYEFILNYELNNIRQIDLSNIMLNYCIDNGIKLDLFLTELIKNKNIDPSITLSDLYSKTNKRLILTTMCLNDPTKPVYLWYKTHPDLSLLVALRMTSALVPYYCSIEYLGKMYADGGYIDNYPMRIFRGKLDKVIGLYLTKNIEIKETSELNSSIINYVGRIFDCFRHGININCLKGYEKYTIKIHLSGEIETLNYNLNRSQKESIFNLGYESAIKYFNN